MNGFDIFPFGSFLILLIIITVRIVSLKRKGVLVSSTAKKGLFTKLLFYPVFLFILFLWIYEIVRLPFQLSFSLLPEIITTKLFDLAALKIAGVLVITVSLVFFALTLLHFKNSLRFGMDSNNRGKLITSGVFSVSRNPFFVSLELYFVGIFLLLPSLFYLIIATSAVVSIHLFILKEEKFMQQNYGEEYKSYTKKVGRYI